jgi:hypothetical protein
VIFFAGVSRSREVYVLAANWLQSLAWHADAKLLKAIVDFYTKAKAFERECREAERRRARARPSARSLTTH